jgi:hypothetical protein
MRLLPAIATALLAATCTTACGTGDTGRTSQPAAPAPTKTLLEGSTRSSPPPRLETWTKTELLSL